SCEKDDPINDQNDVDTLLSKFIIGEWNREFQGGLLLCEFSTTDFVQDFVTATDDTIHYNPIKYSVDDKKHWLKLKYDTEKNYVVEWDEGYMIWNNPDEYTYDKWIRREE
ncbi:hypothetical protein ACFLTA_08360, partial [Bacteroidota bacterium]